MADFTTARELLREFKGDTYLHGTHVLSDIGSHAAGLGSRAALVCDTFKGSAGHVETISKSLAAAGIEVVGRVDGAAPNAPREDLLRITGQLEDLAPDLCVSFGGGSTIDAVKAADVLRTLGGTVDDYFGVGLVTEALAAGSATLPPHIAVESAASSGAHLTKYSNITDVDAGQKKLIVDDAIIPPRSAFDYAVTHGAPDDLTADGALDGIAHCLETVLGAVGKPEYEQLERVAREGIRLVVEHLPQVLADSRDAEGREALGLATDLGGYAIMLGGTNGPHLTSFSLVDLLSHGRACAIMGPYYAVLFAPATERPLRVLGGILKDAGHLDEDVDALGGRDLGMAVARGLIAFERLIGYPATLGEVPGFSEAHIERALTAAKNPQLRMKLENMPVPLTAEMVDEYMGPVLRAAYTGDLELIRNVA